MLNLQSRKETKQSELAWKTEGLALLLATYLILLIIPFGSHAQCTEAYVPDPALASVLREALGKTQTESLCVEELATLIELNASGREISDLEGIQHCIHLTQLWLSDNQISDVGPLGGLSDLYNLQLGENQISNVNSLGTLYNLQILLLYGNLISDVNILAELSNLVDLSLEGNQVSDITSLAALSSLSGLYLYGNQISDITPLEGLTNLRDLGLYENQISEITPLLNNPGIGVGDSISLHNNYLDIACPNSPARLGIEELEARGAQVTWLPQNNSAPDDTPPDNPVVTSSSHQVGVASSNDQVVISISGATDNCSVDGYEYAWDQNESWTPSNTKMVDSTWTGDTFTAAAAGNWYFHITTVDTSGNWSSPTTFGPIVISQCVSPTVNTGPDQTLTCSQPSVTLDATVTGGTTPYTYEWTDSSGAVIGNTEDITVSLAGTYTLTGTGNNGCSASDSVVVTDERGSIVNFPDPGLDAVIRNAIGKPTDDIYECDLVGLTSLDGKSRDISNLEGIQHCVDLNILGLDRNQIVDVSPLGGLTQLTYLDLEANQIVDFSSLAGLTSLRILGLGTNQLVDISPIASLIDLTHLSFAGNQIVDFSPLSSLTKLVYLRLDSNRVADLSPLESLVNLVWLRLKNTRISDISLLSGLTNLEKLDLDSNQIIDISSLSGLTNLKELRLSYNQIADISPLINNPGIRGKDAIWVYRNYLDITCPNSPARLAVEELKARGVNVQWLPQNNSAPDNTPPTNPTASSSSHQVGVASSNDQVVISISGAADNCSVDGYEYAWDQNESWTSTNTKMVDSTWTGDTFTATAYGNWYFHIATTDTSGNWSSPTTFGPIVISQCVSPTVNTGPDQTLTCSQPSVTLDATVTGGAPPYTYEWMDLSGTVVGTTEDITVSSAGTYTLTATEANGCSVSDSVEVTDNRGSLVTFPDPGLNAAVHEALGKATEDPIYECDLEGLTELSAKSRGISNLGGLQYCTALAKLDLYQNDISDITPVTGLTNLTDLRLGLNHISNVTPLAGLTNLTRLHLFYNHISDIEPLAGLTNLTVLLLGGWNQISNITPLAELTNLTRLDLWWTQIMDITPLAGLTNLTVLQLGRNQIMDITPLAGLINLGALQLEDNQISDATPLTELTNLWQLLLSHNQISDINPLKDNQGIGAGDKIKLENNNLDIACPNSPARQAIAEWLDRGVNLTWLPQNNSAPDDTPPDNPVVTSSSHQVGVASSNDQVVISISGATDNCSVDGYEYAWDQNESWTPSNTRMVDSTWTGHTFTAIAYGNWYFHIATTDTSGNWAVAVRFGPIVIANLSHPPVADAGDDLFASEGQLVTIQGSGTDQDQDEIIAFSWSQANGPDVDLLGDDEALVGFYAPDLSCGVHEISLQLVVTDATGLRSQPDEVVVEVEGINELPSLSIDAESLVVDEGATVEFIATSTDMDGTIVHVEWSSESGSFSSETGISTNWTAPLIDSREGVTKSISCTVTDDCGDQATAVVQIQIMNVNTPPMAVPGGPYSGHAGSHIQLDAGDSFDPDGVIVLYEWDLDGDGGYESTGAITEFVSDIVGDHDISLRVTDDEGAVSSIVSTTVTCTNSPPSIPLNGSLVRTASGFLASWKGGDPDGDLVSYGVYARVDGSATEIPVGQIASNTDVDGLILDIPDSCAIEIEWRVVAQDSFGGRTEGSIWTESYAPLTANIGPDQILPCGDECVSVSCQVDGGVPPYAWKITIDGESLASGTAYSTGEAWNQEICSPGSYVLSVTDALGCQASAFCTVSMPENCPPHVPTNGRHETPLQNTSIVTLRWDGGDPDDDAVEYSVYLAHITEGSDGPINYQLMGTSSDTSLSGIELEYGEFYLWYVVAEDEHGVESDRSEGWTIRVRDRMPGAYIVSAAPIDTVSGVYFRLEEYGFDVTVRNTGNCEYSFPVRLTLSGEISLLMLGPNWTGPLRPGEEKTMRIPWLLPTEFGNGELRFECSVWENYDERVESQVSRWIAPLYSQLSFDELPTLRIINRVPSLSISPSAPSDGAIEDPSSLVILSWSMTDSDGDLLEACVELWKDENGADRPLRVYLPTSVSTHVLSGLEHNTDYLWQVFIREATELREKTIISYDTERIEGWGNTTNSRMRSLHVGPVSPELLIAPDTSAATLAGLYTEHHALSGWGSESCQLSWALSRRSVTVCTDFIINTVTETVAYGLATFVLLMMGAPTASAAVSYYSLMDLAYSFTVDWPEEIVPASNGLYSYAEKIANTPRDIAGVYVSSPKRLPIDYDLAFRLVDSVTEYWDWRGNVIKYVSQMPDDFEEVTSGKEIPYVDWDYFYGSFAVQQAHALSQIWKYLYYKSEGVRELADDFYAAPLPFSTGVIQEQVVFRSDLAIAMAEQAAADFEPLVTSALSQCVDVFENGSITVTADLDDSWKWGAKLVLATSATAAVIGERIDELVITEDAAPTIWSNLEPGNYTVLLFGGDPTPLNQSNDSELWAFVDIEISMDKRKHAITLTRDMPQCTGVSSEFDKWFQGDSVQVDVGLESLQARTWPIRFEFVARLQGSSEYLWDETTADLTITNYPFDHYETISQALNSLGNYEWCIDVQTLIDDIWWLTTDSWDWGGTIFTVVVPTGSITATANLTDKQWGWDARFELEAPDGTILDAALASSNKKVTWPDLALGEYTLWMYGGDKTPLTDGEEAELWAYKTIKVTRDDLHPSTTIARNLPTCANAISTKHEWLKGSSVLVDVKLNNNSEETRSVRFRFVADIGKSSPYDWDKESSVFSVGDTSNDVDATKRVSKVLNTLGTYKWIILVETKVDSTWYVTDSWDWGDSIFSVVVPSSGSIFVTVQDIHGVAYPSARVILSGDALEATLAGTSDAIGRASWSNLPFGNYEIAVYGGKTTPAGYYNTEDNLELWWQGVVVLSASNSKPAITAKRNMPYIECFTFRDNSGRVFGPSACLYGSSPSQSVPIGVEVESVLGIANPGDMQIPVRVKVVLSHYKSTSKDRIWEESSDETPLAASGSRTFCITDREYFYKPRANKTVYFSAALQCRIDEDWITTDSWGWSYAFDLIDAPELTVTARALIPEPDDMVTVEGIVTNSGNKTAEDVVLALYGASYLGPARTTLLKKHSLSDLRQYDEEGDVEPGNNMGFVFPKTGPWSGKFAYFYVLVDPDDSIQESDESNNWSERIEVPLWQPK